MHRICPGAGEGHRRSFSLQVTVAPGEGEPVSSPIARSVISSHRESAVRGSARLSSPVARARSMPVALPVTRVERPLTFANLTCCPRGFRVRPRRWRTLVGRWSRWPQDFEECLRQRVAEVEVGGSLGWSPLDRLVVGGDALEAGGDDFQTHSSRFAHVDREGLPVPMASRAPFDRDSGFAEDLGGTDDVGALVDLQGEVVKPASVAGVVTQEGQLERRTGGQGCEDGQALLGHLRPFSEEDAEVPLIPLRVPEHVCGGEVHMVEVAGGDSAGGGALRAGGQRRGKVLRCLVVLGLPEDLLLLPIGPDEEIRLSLPGCRLLPAETPVVRAEPAVPRGRGLRRSSPAIRCGRDLSSGSA